MATRDHLKSEAGPAAMNITPLIDMVFILLIFFVIAVTENDEVWVDRQRVDPRSVRGHVERLHAENPEGSVVILADEESRTGLVIEVLDQARLAGVENVAVAATQPGQ